MPGAEAGCGGDSGTFPLPDLPPLCLAFGSCPLHCHMASAAPFTTSISLAVRHERKAKGQSLEGQSSFRSFPGFSTQPILLSSHWSELGLMGLLAVKQSGGGKRSILLVFESVCLIFTFWLHFVEFGILVP